MLNVWRLTCQDPSGLVFTYYSWSPSRAKAEREVTAKGWRVRMAERENVFTNLVKQMRGELTYSARVKIKPLIGFYKQFSNMLTNDVPVPTCLKTTADSTDSKMLKKVIVHITNNVEGGEDLASAMARFPNIFDRMSATILRAAQMGGYLQAALESLAKSAKLTYEVNKKLNSAMIYPTAVLFVAMVAILIFAFKVIPNFEPLYKTVSLGLPFPTKVLLMVSKVLTQYPFLAAPMLLAPVWLFLKKREIAVKPWVQTLFHKMPGIRDVTRNIYLARYSRMMSQLTAASIPFPTQMLLMREASSVHIYRNAFAQIEKDLSEGSGLTESLERQKLVFGAFFVGMLRSGEVGGTIEENLKHVAEFYEDEIIDQLKNINSIIEPILIIFLGLVIGFMLFAMFLPLFDIAQLVK